MQHRQLQGMIPDFKIQTADGKNGISGKIRLGELKGIGNVKTHYPRKAGLAAQTPYHGVNQRARRLDGEYLRKAKSLDQKFNGTAGGVVGPVEQHLRSYQYTSTGGSWFSSWCSGVW